MNRTNIRDVQPGDRAAFTIRGRNVEGWVIFVRLLSTMGYAVLAWIDNDRVCDYTFDQTALDKGVIKVTARVDAAEGGA